VRLTLRRASFEMSSALNAVQWNFYVSVSSDREKTRCTWRCPQSVLTTKRIAIHERQGRQRQARGEKRCKARRR